MWQREVFLTVVEQGSNDAGPSTAVPPSAVSVWWPHAILLLSKHSASSYPAESVILGRDWLRLGKGSSSVPSKEEATALLCGDTVK